jgi:hypothetical protein
MRLDIRTSVTGLALVVAGSPLLGVATPADAAPVGAGRVPCVKSARTAPAPDWRQYEDTTKVTPQDLAAMPKAETSKQVVAQQVAPQLGTSVTVPVFVHVIKGRHRGERSTAGPKRVARMIATLNDAYNGGQDPAKTTTRYRFKLRHIDYTRRDGWYHAFLYGPRDAKAKRALHRGDQRSLNIYINGGGTRDTPVLGWARFPWQYKQRPRLDGVSVNVAGLPGGRATGYNLGDTVVHETGHWLGLFHTFQGGCSSSNDMVGDTPAEAEPSFYCEDTRNTCASPGTDPVHNFMDYSLDSCMYMFTPGQVRRMDAAYNRWRR